MIRAIWRKLFGDPGPDFEYCNICHTYEVLPDTHLCFGPLICDSCGEEIVIESPPGAGRPIVFGHIPCPGRPE